MSKGKHIAVMGYPRSGSTMFYCMLRSTVEGYRFYHFELKAKQAFIKEPNVDKITKNPADIRDVDWLYENISSVRFILCIRDPRSVLVSKMMDGRFKVYWDYCMHKYDGKIDKNDGFITRHKQVVNTLKYEPFICKFEDLIHDPVKMQKELGEYFNLEYKDKFENFYKQHIPKKLERRLNGIRPIEEARIDSWKDYPRRIIQQFTECPELFDIVKFWGYEENDDWFNELKKQA